MIVGVPKEILDQEGRVAAIPETVREYIQMGFKVAVQSAAGQGALFGDQAYAQAGAMVVEDPAELFRASDVVLKVKQPWRNEAGGYHEADMIRERAVLIAFLHPAAPVNHEMVSTLARRNITAFSMDAIPRISRAQRMDALTSMSTISGYKAMLIAANRFPKFIPMTGTTIGTIKPARVLFVGAGVVGLQAIVTAKRLGASVTAVDVSDEARKTAASLGAKIAGFEVPAELAVGPDGRTRSLPEEWLQRERALLEPLVQQADIVILSALVPGEVAPLLVTEAMLGGMKPGSIIVDVAIDQGGNCSVTPSGGEASRHGVSIFGLWNIPGSMPVHGSWLYAHNVLHYVQHLFHKGLDSMDLEDEIIRESLVTHEGRIVHRGTLKAMGLSYA
jgi:H+-translocating NAD(P) transhydrogenase subunit alpha